MGVKPYFALMRPVNVGISFLSIFIGAFITGTIFPINKVLLACLSGGLIAGGAYAVNDIYDFEIDRINKPWRPLPSGRLNPRKAWIFALLLSVLGLIAGATVNFAALLLALLACLFLFFYNAKLKRAAFWGNLSVSFIAGLAFVYGGLAVGRITEALIPAGFALLFHLGREIIKDVEDVEGDKAQKAFTLPIRYGKKWALIAVTSVFTLLIVSTFLPFLYKIYGLLYLLIVLFGVDLVILYIILSMWQDFSPHNLGRLSSILKADMLVGLLAIYFGK